MTQAQNDYILWLGRILTALYRDRVAVAAVTLIVAAAAAAVGKLTNSTTSTADLLLTPLALQQVDTEEGTVDSLGKMLAEPLDVTTVSLICKSDETLSATMERLNESGQLEKPIEDLNKLYDAMDFNITISKDTPYITEYSPILQLTVKWGNSAEAKHIVDTWAEVCVEHAELYRSLQQAPAATAFQEQRNKVRTALDTAEQDLENFLKKNNREYLDKRVEHLTLLTTDYLQRRSDKELELAASEAIAEAMQTALASEEATRELNWQPSGKLVGLIDLPKGEEDPDAPTALRQEVINPLYDFMRERLATAKASVAEHKASLEKINAALTAFETEMQTLQERRAQVKREEDRLLREVDILNSAYKDAAIKDNYAIMASSLDQPALHVLSHGAEWRMPRFRRAILFGAAGAVFGFGIAAGLSLALRLIVAPAMKQAA